MEGTDIWRLSLDAFSKDSQITNLIEIFKFRFFFNQNWTFYFVCSWRWSSRHLALCRRLNSALLYTQASCFEHGGFNYHYYLEVHCINVDSFIFSLLSPSVHSRAEGHQKNCFTVSGKQRHLGSEVLNSCSVHGLGTLILIHSMAPVLLISVLQKH